MQILKKKLLEAEAELQSIKEGRATESNYGLSKISAATSVTENNGLVLSAKEKNPSQGGSLANQILQVNNKIESFFKIEERWLIGEAEDAQLKNVGGNRYRCEYDLGVAPTEYKFLFGVPHISWFSSNEFHDIDITNTILTRMKGNMDIYVNGETSSELNSLTVFSCFCFFIKE